MNQTALADDAPVLRFARPHPAPEPLRQSSVMALVSAWLVVALVPLLWGRAVAFALDEPLLGLVAGLLAMIPLMIALCPRFQAERPGS